VHGWKLIFSKTSRRFINHPINSHWSISKSFQLTSLACPPYWFFKPILNSKLLYSNEVTKKILLNAFVFLAISSLPLLAQTESLPEPNLSPKKDDSETLTQKLNALEKDALLVLENLEYHLPKFKKDKSEALKNSQSLRSALRPLLEKEQDEELDLAKIIDGIDQASHYMTKLVDAMVLEEQTLVETLHALEKIDELITNDSNNQKLAHGLCGRYPPFCFRKTLEQDLQQQLHEVEAFLPILKMLNSVISD